MLELLTSINALTVFLGIAAIGFSFLIVSLVFGEIFDSFDLGDHDFDHDGPGFFSPRVISVFVTAFGGFGAIGVYQGLSVFTSSLLGVAGGIVLAGVVFAFARFLYGQQASSTVMSSDLLGRTAEVTVSIPAGGAGRVRCVIGETAIDKIARSKDGVEVPYNALVKIEEIVGESVVVSPTASSQPWSNTTQS